MTSAYHDNLHRPARMTTGEVYVPRPADSGLCRTMSCIRCWAHRGLSLLEKDDRFRGQRRCIDREACAVARGGNA